MKERQKYTSMPELKKQSSIMKRSGKKKEKKVFKMTTAPIYREDSRPLRKRLTSIFS